MLPHRRAGLRRATRIGPNRVIDIETAAALLAKPVDSTLRLLGAPAPHSPPAETAHVGHRGSQPRRAGAAHWRLQDRPFEVQFLGKGIRRPHARVLPSLARARAGYPQID